MVVGRYVLGIRHNKQNYAGSVFLQHYYETGELEKRLFSEKRIAEPIKRSAKYYAISV